MGDIVQTLFGGSKQHESSTGNTSSNSNNVSGNYALNFLMSMLGPSLNSVNTGSDMMGALLGVPGYANRPVGQPTPTPVPVPQFTPPTLPPALRHVDLFHDGINGNGKTAKKRGLPTDYWVDAYGRPATPPPSGGSH